MVVNHWNTLGHWRNKLGTDETQKDKNEDRENLLGRRCLWVFFNCIILWTMCQPPLLPINCWRQTQTPQISNKKGSLIETRFTLKKKKRTVNNIFYTFCIFYIGDEEEISRDVFFLMIVSVWGCCVWVESSSLLRERFPKQSQKKTKKRSPNFSLKTVFLWIFSLHPTILCIVTGFWQ